MSTTHAAPIAASAKPAPPRVTVILPCRNEARYIGAYPLAHAGCRANGTAPERGKLYWRMLTT
jgi:hypothetical protein